MNYFDLQGIELSAVDSALERFVREQQSCPSGAGIHGRSLWEEVLEHTRSGKRLRSRLVMLAACSNGPHDHEAAAAVAAAYGLLHAAFILHDDVIDRDDMRYGRPSLHAAHAAGAASRGMSDDLATHRGYTRSILAGDLALAAAYRLLLAGTADVPAPAREELQRILHDTVVTTTLGELLDVELSFSPDQATTGEDAGDPREKALRTAELKTAVYTFCAPLQSGALLAGLGADQVAAVGRAGTHLGMAFQLEDDLLGVFGDPGAIGKPVGGDLREGKHTYLMATALASEAASEVKDLLSRACAADDDELSRINLAMRELLTRCGALQATADQIRDHARQARDEIAGAALPGPLGDALAALAEEIGSAR